MTDTSTTWHIRGNVPIPLLPFTIMGIVNYTPDSFVPSTQNKALAGVLDAISTHVNAGATIIDIGAESTKPNAVPVPQEEETKKLLQVLDAIATVPAYKNVLISIDTYKAFTAHAVLERGCHIINDISGFQIDPKLIETICAYKPGYILTHNTRTRPSPRGAYSIEDSIRYFEERLNMLIRKGLPETNVIFDIGIGFGLAYPESIQALKTIERLHTLGRPLCIGISHKTWFQPKKAISHQEKEYATMITTALLAEKGILVHRVHNTKQASLALTIANTIQCKD